MLTHGMDTRRVPSPLLTAVICFALAIGLGAFSPISAQVGGISGFVLDNTNNPIPNVTVELRDAAQNLLNAMPTGGSGQYAFDSVVAGGTYVLRVVPPPGFTVQRVSPSPPASAFGSSGILITNFNPGTSYANNNFVLGPSALFPPPGTGMISGSVLQDSNGNGMIDPSDVGIPGVQVLLLASTGLVVEMATTDSSGTWAFSTLTPGTYQVMQVASANIIPVAAFPGPGATLVNSTTIQVTLSAGASGMNNFLDRVIVVTTPGGTGGPGGGGGAPGTISGSVFQDVNGNGMIDLGVDTPIPGVQILLFTDQGTQIGIPVTTDASGAYTFTNLAPGTYVVMQMVPPNFTAVTAIPGPSGMLLDPVDIQVTLSGEAAGNNNFLDIGPGGGSGGGGGAAGTISGQVLKDVNGNGTLDLGVDTPIAGAMIQLFTEEGTQIGITVTTGADGAWAFTNMASGTYFVMQTPPPGKTAEMAFTDTTGMVIGPDTIQVTLSSSGSSTNNNFLDTGGPGGAGDPPAATAVLGASGTGGTNTISGFAIEDRNQNGIADSEPGLAGMRVVISDQFGSPVGSMVTDFTGIFRFSSLAEGTYTLTAIPPSGRNNTNTIPAQGGTRLSASVISVTTIPGITDYPGQLFLAGP